jgi:hypothetical protein
MIEINGDTISSSTATNRSRNAVIIAIITV